MNFYNYLIVWEGRRCVDVIDYDTDSAACLKAVEAMNEPLERGIVPARTAQSYSVYPKDSLDIYVGYERDEGFETRWTGVMIWPMVIFSELESTFLNSMKIRIVSQYFNGHSQPSVKRDLYGILVP